MSFHQSRGLDVTCPSAASTTMGGLPHRSVVVWNCVLMFLCGSTFSIKDRMWYSGSSRRMCLSMSVIWESRDPSVPSVPGGSSRSLEWSLHGGADVITMI